MYPDFRKVAYRTSFKSSLQDATKALEFFHCPTPDTWLIGVGLREFRV